MSLKISYTDSLNAIRDFYFSYLRPDDGYYDKYNEKVSILFLRETRVSVVKPTFEYFS